jgi:hypothetical protein
VVGFTTSLRGKVPGKTCERRIRNNNNNNNNVSFLWVKRLESGADHSPQSRAEFNNEWTELYSYFPIRFYGAVLKHRENFISVYIINKCWWVGDSLLKPLLDCRQCKHISTGYLNIRFIYCNTSELQSNAYTFHMFHRNT